MTDPKTGNLSKTNFADVAEKVIQKYKQEHRKMLSTSQLRNILGRINSIGEKSKNRTGYLTDEELSSIQYLKMRIAYDAGRERQVKEFVEATNLFSLIDNIGKDRDKLDTFYSYFEALVAYHRFYDGK